MADERASLLPTLTFDVGFFAVCVLGVRLYRCWDRRHARRNILRHSWDGHSLDGQHRERAAPLLHGGPQLHEASLNATAKNYLAFLRTGAWLFLALSAISLGAYEAFGLSHDYAGANDLQSLGKIAFDNSTNCSAGFPASNGSGVLNCTGGDDPDWKLHVPQRGDPRPAAYYRVNASLADCRKEATVCGAARVAYSPAGRQCWLFNASAGVQVVGFEDFVVCQGRRALLPGRETFLLVLAYGVVTILFALVFLRRLSTRQINELSRLTLWLTEIPTADREDGTPFELDEHAFVRVGKDLGSAITSEIDRRLEAAGIEGSLLEEAKVAHVPYVVHSAASQGHLAGHAFATLSREAYVSAMLLRNVPLCGLACLRWLPSYVHWRSHTLLKFGIPPWSAVTLRCQRAPPPSDIIWDNLHMRYAWLGSLLLQLLLFAVMLVFVAPVSLASSVYAVVDSMRQDKEVGKMLPEEFWEQLEHVVQQLPSYWLLLMDSIILPYGIEFISNAERPHLYSRGEASQFRLNLHFLLLNALLVPLLGFFTTSQSILEQAMAYYSSTLEGGSLRHTLHSVAQRGLQIPGTLILKYLLNAALVSTGFQLIQVRNIFLQCMCMGESPWVFAWGYWYAWSMSILFIALSMSILMPAVLPVAMLSFLLMHWVHRGHLERGIFEVPVEMDRRFEVGVVARMVQAVVLFWMLMAIGFYTRPLGGMDEVLSLWVPCLPGGLVTAAASGVLIVLAFLAGFGGRLLFAEDGWLERRVWRRLGEHGSSRVLSGCYAVALLCLLAASVTRPHVVLRRVRVEQHVVFASALVGFAFLAWLVSLAVQWLGARLIRGTTLQRLSKAAIEKSEYCDQFDLVTRLGAKRKSVLVDRKMWYLPLRRKGTMQT